jgi:hypothetical protein
LQQRFAASIFGGPRAPVTKIRTSDSDSTALIAGQLYGAKHGLVALLKVFN